MSLKINLLLVALLTWSTLVPAKGPDTPPVSLLAGTSFTENKGQICDQNYQPRPDVLFSGSDGRLNYFLRNSGISYQLVKVETWKKLHEGFSPRGNGQSDQDQIPDQIRIGRIDIEWVNASPPSEVLRDRDLPGYKHFYLAHCPSGITDVKSYTGVTLNEIYPGIAVHYYQAPENSEQRTFNLKSDYIVAPHADYRQIRLRVKGAEISMMEDGSISLNTPLGTITEGAPIVFQAGQQLQARWVIKGEYLEFEIEGYDPAMGMIIDPITRIWGTYYGGSGSETPAKSDADPSGNVFITGSTFSTAGIATTGAHQTVLSGGADAFLAKFSPAGALLWGTYFGGSSFDLGFSCATDNSGNVYATGVATSTNAVATPGAYQTIHGGNSDAFLVKFNGSGARQWGTYFGGSLDEEGYSVATDASGNVYLVGYTNSSNGISTSGAHQASLGGAADAFVAKFNSSGSRQWGTYYGGTGSDGGYGCDTDASGNIFFGGTTNSTAGIASPGAHQTSAAGQLDAFLVKLNSAGARIWGTYYGGSADDFGACVTVDPSGNVAMGGTTSSTSGIASASSHQATYGGGTDGFFAKFSTAGVRVWGTYYGGTSSDEVYGSCSDAAGNLHITGPTGSATGISTPSGYQPVINGVGDAFHAILNGSGVRQLGTYYGGPNAEKGYSCVVTNSGAIYLLGQTWSTSGIATPGAPQGTLATGPEGFLAKFFDCSLTISGTNQTAVSCFGGNDGTASVSISGGTPNFTYAWSPGGGTSATVTGLSAGTYTCTVTDLNGCPATQSVTITEPTAIAIVPSQVNVSCLGGSDGSASVSVSGGTPGYNYSWSPGGGTSATVAGLSAGTYTCTITDLNGCPATQSVTITEPTAIALAPSQTNVSCSGGNDGTATVSASGGTPGYNYAWSPGGATSATATGLSAGTYTCTVTDLNGCTAIDSVTLTEPTAIAVAPSQTDISCFGGADGSASVMVNGGTPGYTYLWTPGGDTSASVTGLSAGPHTCTITDLNGCTATQSFTITEPPAISVTPSQFNVSCFGETDGRATVTASGGVPGYSYLWSPGGDTTVSITDLPAGTYTCTVTDDNGCTFVETFTITEPAQIDTSVSVNGNTISSNNPNATWQWLDCQNGNAAIPGATSQSFSPANSGLYAVALFQNGCADTSACQTFTMVGMPGTSEPDFSFYPNPTTGPLTVEFSTPVPKVNIRVINVFGQVLEENALTGASRVDLEIDGCDGVYFVEVTLPRTGTRQTFKVIKKK